MNTTATKKVTAKKTTGKKTEKPKKGTYQALLAAADFAKKSGLSKTYGQ